MPGIEVLTLFEALVCAVFWGVRWQGRLARWRLVSHVKAQVSWALTIRVGGNVCHSRSRCDCGTQSFLRESNEPVSTQTAGALIDQLNIGSQSSPLSVPLS